MYEFKRWQEGTRTGWHPIMMPNGELHASIHCPKCQTEVFLGDKSGNLHRINSDGTVTPSVLHDEVVPDERFENRCSVCGWHDIIKLLDWQPKGG